MLQKTKSMLTKLLMLLCVVCCAVALAFGLAGCSGDPTVVDMKIVDGELILYYSDGSTVNRGPIGGETETQVTVVDVTYSGNTVTIHYSDGKTETFTIDIPEDETCEHENMSYIVLSTNPNLTSWTCDMGGKLLAVCNDCGYSTIIEVAPGAHNYETKVVAPTCMSDGYTAEVCIYCGEVSDEKTDIVPATGEHKYSETGYEVANLGSTICEGGWIVYPCEYDCGFVKFEELAPKGHTVSADDVTITDPADPDGAGNATAYCSTCGKSFNIVIPQITNETLSKFTYEITDDVVNCSDEMEATFTYTDPETGITVEFESKLPAGYHKLNGVAIDDKQVITYTGVDSLPEGMTIAGNDNNGEITCSDTGVYAVFNCDDCGRPIVVKIRVPHTALANVSNNTVDADEYAEVAKGYSDGKLENETEVEYVARQFAAQISTDASAASHRTMYTYAAACSANGGHQGFKVYYCSVCKQVVTDILPVPEHDVTYTAAPNAAGNIVITADCENCTYGGTVELEDCKTTVVTPVTCENDGVTTYTGTVVGTPSGIFAADGDKAVTVGKSATITAVIAKTNHVHPVYGDEFDSDPNTTEVYYVEDYPEMELSANSADSCAENGSVWGVFICETCGDTIVIPMQWKHVEPTVTTGTNVVDLSKVTDNADYNAIKDRASAENYFLVVDADDSDAKTIIYKPATCTTAGFRTFICSKCGEVAFNEILPLGHDFKYNLEAATEEDIKEDASRAGKYHLYATCENEDEDIIYGGNTEGGVDEWVTYYADKDKMPPNPEPPYAYVASETEATCSAPSSKTIVAVFEVTVNKETEVVERRFTETGDSARHTLNGVKVNDKDYFDPNVTPGITPSGNYNLTCAGEGGLGVFTCEVCGKPIVVKIRDAHEVPTKTSNKLPEGYDWANINPAKDETESVYTGSTTGLDNATYYVQAASCTDGGKYIYYCSECKQWICGVTEATGHDYGFKGYSWTEKNAAGGYVFEFTVNFECKVNTCEDTASITLTPFEQDGNVLTLDKAYTLVSFNEPTHNSYGYFTVKYTVTAKDINAVEGANSVADDFKLEVTLSGSLSTETFNNKHFHINAPVVPEEPADPDQPVIWDNSSKNFYWFVDETAEDGTVTRTYYVAHKCDDCGLIYMTKEDSYEDEKIPESDLPCYEWAVAADKAAKEEADKEEATEDTTEETTPAEDATASVVAPEVA